MKTDIYMQSGNSAILYVTVMLNDALFFFLLPLSLFICFRFSFFFFVLSCPVCVKVIFFCLKSVEEYALPTYLTHLMVISGVS